MTLQGGVHPAQLKDAVTSELTCTYPEVLMLTLRSLC